MEPQPTAEWEGTIDQIEDMTKALGMPLHLIEEVRANAQSRDCPIWKCTSSTSGKCDDGTPKTVWRCRTYRDDGTFCGFESWDSCS